MNLILFNIEQYKRYAYSIISEYLPTDIQNSLLKHLGLPEKVESTKRKADVNGTDLNKKVKHNEVQYDEMSYKVEKVNYFILDILVVIFRFFYLN